MAWVQHANILYFYEYIKRDGVRRTIYHGNGSVAALAAERIEFQKASRIKQRRLRQRIIQSLNSGEQVIVDYCSGVHQLFIAHMRFRGYHKHEGIWRKTGPMSLRRMRTQGHSEISKAIEAEKRAAYSRKAIATS